jgi:hypothetical protein
LFLRQAWKYLSVRALYHFSIIMQQFSKSDVRAFSKEAGGVRQKRGLVILAYSAAEPFKLSTRIPGRFSTFLTLP